jgi:Tfp pilus assembly protein PilP
MTLRIGILLLGVMVTGAVAQNPDAIDNTRNTLQAVSKKETNDQNAALATAGQSQQPAASQPGTAGQPAAKQVSGKAAAAGASRPAVKPAPLRIHAAGAAAKSAHPKPKAKTEVATKPPAAPPPPAVAVEDKKNPEESKKRESKEYSAAGRRDPFVSPVVNHISGPTGCSTGKRCLEIGQIMLTGIVKSENGMIAVVVNSLNKAYFLRENDPVFNGYVVKITGDSVIFSESGQDQLGKPFTREITKKIATPAA